MANSSTIKKIKEPDFSKEVTIKELHATKETIDWHFNQMKKALGDKATDQQIWTRINSLVLRDNIFNEAMKIIVPCYEIKLDPDDVKHISDLIRKDNPALAKVPENLTNMMAQRMLEKKLVFECLAKEENVTVSDEEVTKMLDAYYKATNQPVRDILNNAQMLENVKGTILEQKMADIVCKKLKWKADWEAIQKAAQANNAQVLKEKEEAEAKKGDGKIVEK